MDFDKCIVYALVDPRDETVRYIGITSNPDRRKRQHLGEIAPTGGTHYRRWQKKLRNLGLVPRWEVLEEDLTWDEARELEREWIASGREDGWPLTNITDGGGGAGPEKMREIWAQRSEEERKSILASLHKAAHSPETRAKVAETLRKQGFWDYDDERRAKCGNAMRGKTHTPEAKAKISASLKGRKKSPEHVAKAAAAMKATKNTPEWKKKIRASGVMKGRPRSEETRKKMSEGLKAAWARGAFGEERNRKVGEATRRFIKEGILFNEEHRRNISEGKKMEYPALFNIETGKEIPPGRGLGDMCRKHGLNRGEISKIVRGIRTRPFKGWVLK